MKRYTLKEINWLKQNYSKIGSRKCSEYLKRPISSVRQTANKLKCYVSRDVINKNHSETLIENFKPSIDLKKFTEIKNKEVAYVLGMLWADGWLQYKNDYSVNIKLVSEDFKKILPIFYKIGEWKKYTYKPKNRKEIIQLRLSGKCFTDYLISLDYHIKSGKSPYKVLKKIPKKFLKYWWRGYFDGDGYIKCDIRNKLSITSTCNQDWSFLPENVNFKKIIKKDKHSYSKVILSSKKEIKKFGNIIWKNWDGLGLLRKYQEFQKLL